MPRHGSLSKTGKVRLQDPKIGSRKRVARFLGLAIAERMKNVVILGRNVL